MQVITTPQARLALSKASGLMSEALELLDETHAPGRIGATLDMAIARLEEFLGRDEQAPGIQELMAQLEREFADTPTLGASRPNPWQIPPA